MKLTVPLVLLLSTHAYSFNCDSDCGKAARFKYPCPTFGKPYRKCYGRDPVTFATCESEKKLSCDAIQYFSRKLKPHLIQNYNAEEYQNFESKATYMAYCTAAVTSLCTAIGAQAGPYGAVIGGSGGAFMSFQICKQSTKWSK